MHLAFPVRREFLENLKFLIRSSFLWKEVVRLGSRSLALVPNFVLRFSKSLFNINLPSVFGPSGDFCPSGMAKKSFAFIISPILLHGQAIFQSYFWIRGTYVHGLILCKYLLLYVTISTLKKRSPFYYINRSTGNRAS